MPGRTIPISVTEAVPFESGAWLLSRITYLDDNRVFPFTAGLCRIAQNFACEVDPQWDVKPHLLHPWIYSFSDKECKKHMRSGLTLLGRRVWTADKMLRSHLRSAALGLRFARQDHFVPTVKNIAAILMPEFGWDGDSEATFKSRIWGPMRPVSHLAFVVAMRWLSEGRKNELDQQGVLRALFPSANEVREMLRIAEKIRIVLPHLKQFRIKEENTYKFVGFKANMSKHMSRDSECFWSRPSEK